MRRMSFALTTEQILNQTKTVTRRNRWVNLKPGDLIQPVKKCMGLKKGEKQVLLGCPILIKSVTFEPLHVIDTEELVKEGFPQKTKEEFIELYCKANKCTPDKIITRIEFEYTVPLNFFCNRNKNQHLAKCRLQCEKCYNTNQNPKINT